MRLIDADNFANRMYHEAFEKDSVMQRWDSGCWIRYKLFEIVLREQPTAHPERRKGKWIERWHDNKHVIGDMACSVCGAQMLLTFPRFCPCCGAYMREEERDG